MDGHKNRKPHDARSHRLIDVPHVLRVNGTKSPEAGVMYDHTDQEAWRGANGASQIV